MPSGTPAPCRQDRRSQKVDINAPGACCDSLAKRKATLCTSWVMDQEACCVGGTAGQGGKVDPRLNDHVFDECRLNRIVDLSLRKRTPLRHLTAELPVQYTPSGEEAAKGLRPRCQERLWSPRLLQPGHIVEMDNAVIAKKTGWTCRWNDQPRPP